MPDELDLTSLLDSIHEPEPEVGFMEMGLPEVEPEPEGIIQVQNPMPGINEMLDEHPVYCPDHDLRMRLTYGNLKGNLYYCCPEWAVSGCSGTVGAHPNGVPLGWPADAETKKARKRAHKAFDKLWKTGFCSRSRAYEWLREVMDLSAEAAHIGKMDKDQCEMVCKHSQRVLR